MVTKSDLSAPPGPVLVMGAGSVGCYVGACLQRAGAPVHFVGRPRVLQALGAYGLRATDWRGASLYLRPEELALHGEIPAGLAPALVLLCVKSASTADAARDLQARLPAGTAVLSLQNGLCNAAVASDAARSLRVLPGVVGFNIAELAPGHWHRGTEGGLAAQDAPVLRTWAPWFAHAGLPLAMHRDLRPVQWGKLLLNLNNPVNALSGLRLRAELLERRHRILFAALVAEALLLLRADRIEPARMTPLPWDMFVRVLRLPTPIFRLVAARMLRIDDRARSSMADDLAMGRRTEIDALCGEIVRLAHRLGRDAPVSAAVMERIEVMATRADAAPNPIESPSTRDPSQ